MELLLKMEDLVDLVAEVEVLVPLLQEDRQYKHLDLGILDLDHLVEQEDLALLVGQVAAAEAQDKLVLILLLQISVAQAEMDYNILYLDQHFIMREAVEVVVVI
jgi:hypothetical protein